MPQHQRYHERRIESTIGQLSADEKQCRLPPETTVLPYGTVDYRLIEGLEITVLDGIDYCLLTDLVSAGQQVQYDSGECHRSLRGNEGHRDSEQEGPISQHPYHCPFRIHGHIPESHCAIGH